MDVSVVVAEGGLEFGDGFTGRFAEVILWEEGGGEE